MRFAAPVDVRLLRMLRRACLDVPVAETFRELGREAERLGLTRPSYAAVRLYVEEERQRRAERDAAFEVAALLAFTRAVLPTLDGVEREYVRAVQRRRRQW
jgi:hypothetical protein